MDSIKDTRSYTRGRRIINLEKTRKQATPSGKRMEKDGRVEGWPDRRRQPRRDGTERSEPREDRGRSKSKKKKGDTLLASNQGPDEPVYPSVRCV